jgi:hypothetical protein
MTLNMTDSSSEMNKEKQQKTALELVLKVIDESENRVRDEINDAVNELGEIKRLLHICISRLHDLDFQSRALSTAIQRLEKHEDEEE